MRDVSPTAAIIQLRALLAADAQIDLCTGRRLILRAASRITNQDRANLYIDHLEAVLLSYMVAANRTDFEVSRRIGNKLIDAIEMASRPS